jgi:hypothetical protein
MSVHSAPFIAVSDVIATGLWYQRLLECRNEHPDDSEFGKLVDENGDTLLLLHCWDAEPDVPIDRLFVNRDAAPLGHGLLLTFVMDDFPAAAARAHAHGYDIVEEIHQLPDRSQALWLRDPDGYHIQLSSPAPAT